MRSGRFGAMMMLTIRQKQRLTETLRLARRDKAFFAKAFFGIELAGKQVDAVNLGGRVNVKVAGRRFGKSTTTLVDVVHECATKPKQQWYITGDRKSVV